MRNERYKTSAMMEEALKAHHLKLKLINYACWFGIIGIVSMVAYFTLMG